MAKKLNFDQEVEEAVQVGRTGPGSRFARARETLKERPTGYVEAPLTDEEQSKAPAPLVDSTAKLTTSKKPVDNKAPNSLVLAVGQAASRLGVPTYQEVPIDLVLDNPYNARYFYKPEKVADLARSMAADGQLIPGLAVKRGNEFILIAGHYRKKGAKQAALPTLKLMVYENITDQDLYLLSYKENAEHNEQTVLDNAFAWRRVLDDKLYQSEVELAEAIGMSKSNVNKTLSIMKLDALVLDVIAQNPELYALSVLYEVYLLQQAGGAVMAADMANRVVEQGIGRKEISMMRERVEATGTPVGRRRRNETSRLYRLFNGEVRDWDSGRVVIDVKIENEEEKQAFLEEMRSRFKSNEEAPNG